MQPPSHPVKASSFSVLADAYDSAFRWWRTLLTAVGPPIIAGQVATLLLTVLITNTHGVLMNGRLVPTGPLQRWDITRLWLDAAGAKATIELPIPMVLGWLIAFAVGLAAALDLSAGQPLSLQAVWRPVLRRLPTLLGVAIATAAATAVALYAALVASGIDALVAVGVLMVGALLVVRLGLAWPAAAAEGHGTTSALRRSISLMHSNTVRVGLPVVIGVVLLPALALTAASRIGAGLSTTTWAGGAWWSDAAMAGVASLLTSVVLVAVVPTQAAMLAMAFVRVRSEAAVAPDPAAEPNIADTVPAPSTGRPVVGWRSLVVLGAAVLMPAGLATAYAATNPFWLPVVTVAHQPGWVVSNPLAMGTIADGSPVLVDSEQIIRCVDTRCSTTTPIGFPCFDGVEPKPVPNGTGVGCRSEIPIHAAAVRADGTVVALNDGRHNDVRLFWCRITLDWQCVWGGAAIIDHPPALWGERSVAVASTPGGGVVLAVLSPTAKPQLAGIRLITCTNLACDHRVDRVVAEVSITETGTGGGQNNVALTVDQRSGRLAIAYSDQAIGGVWLGGCPAADCAKPQLRRVLADVGAAWFTSPQTTPQPALASLAIGPTGPIVTVTDPAGLVHLATCQDLSCQNVAETTVAVASAGGPKLVVDDAGRALLITAANSPDGPRLTVGLVADAADSSSTGEPELTVPIRDGQRLLAANASGSGGPHFFLSGPTGLEVVSCRDPLCRPRP